MATLATAGARLGWRDDSEHGTERWPLRYSGVNDDVSWSLSVRPAPGTSDSGIDEDHFWWSTDAIRTDNFVLIAGYTRFRSLDWQGQNGVQNYSEIEGALDAIMNEIGGAAEEAMRTGNSRFIEHLVAIEQRTYLERPWLTIGCFLESASNVMLDCPDLGEVEVKAQHSEFAKQIFSRGVASALISCKEVIKSFDSFFRIWLGAPNLRIHLASHVADDDARIEVCRRVVNLGVALTARYREVVTSRA